MEGFYIILASSLNQRLFKTLSIHTQLLEGGQYMIARLSAEELERVRHWPMEQVAHWPSPIRPYDELHSL